MSEILSIVICVLFLSPVLYGIIKAAVKNAIIEAKKELDEME